MLQSTLGEVVERVVQGHLHRLYVVDEAGRPLNILTLTDILALLVGEGGEASGGG
jgi:predicted transcriptional regulator